MLSGDTQMSIFSSATTSAHQLLELLYLIVELIEALLQFNIPQ